MSVWKRTPRRACSFTLPPRSTSVTEPITREPAGIATRPADSTSRVTRASTRSSMRARSDASDDYICRPMTDAAGRITSSNCGAFGGSGCTSNGFAGSGAGAGGGAATGAGCGSGCEAGALFADAVLAGAAGSACVLRAVVVAAVAGCEGVRSGRRADEVAAGLPADGSVRAADVGTAGAAAVDAAGAADGLVTADSVSATGCGVVGLLAAAAGSVAGGAVAAIGAVSAAL